VHFLFGGKQIKMEKKYLTLYAVTDRLPESEIPLAVQVEKAILGGVTMVQLREKNLKGEALLKEAIEVQKICKKYSIPFIINDDAELAKKIDADGVHLGQSDMAAAEARKLLGEDKIIGVTAKTVAQAKAAEKDGADYLGSGAVFGTNTKLDTKKLDHDLLDEICESVAIPVVAIGGINSENIMKLKGRKMAGVAIAGGIFHKSDIEGAAKELKILADKICLE
jgi:thiamine-phosphate pyrophosphorylase